METLKVGTFLTIPIMKCGGNFVSSIKWALFPQFTVSLFSLQKLNALPALQVYRNGFLVGNFIRLSDEFDDEFYAADVENFLIE